MRSTPSVQRLPFSTRIRGPRLRLRSRRRRHAAAAATPFFLHFVRFGLFGAVAALVLAGTAGRDAACGCSVERYVADVSPVQSDASNETDDVLRSPEETEVTRSATADPAAATGGGGGGSGSGGETPVPSPRPCPTYASPEAMMAAVASS